MKTLVDPVTRRAFAASVRRSSRISAKEAQYARKKIEAAIEDIRADLRLHIGTLR